MEIHMPAQAAQVLERLEAAGYEAYIVGGCVRDSLMGRTPGDYDITSSALPEQVLECFAGERVVPTGIKHGTVTVVLDGMPLEITTFRADGEYTDHRRPDSVAFSAKLEDDLCRRDFTINAMAYSPARGLVDMYGGAQDIGRRVVRCVGQAERRFGEDALRMLRAVRFAAVLGFTIADDTLDALNALRGDIRYVARERICTELGKAVCAQRPGYAFAAGEELILTALGAREEDFGAAGYARAVARMAAVPAQEPLRWAALLMQAGSARAGELLHELKASNAVTDRAMAAIANADCELSDERVAVKRLLRRMGEEGLADVLALRRADAAVQGDDGEQALCECIAQRSEALICEGACWSLKSLAVTGRDMTALGARGRQVGAVLEALLDEVIAETLTNEHDALCRRAAQLI